MSKLFFPSGTHTIEVDYPSVKIVRDEAIERATLRRIFRQAEHYKGISLMSYEVRALAAFLIANAEEAVTVGRDPSFTRRSLNSGD